MDECAAHLTGKKNRLTKKKKEKIGGGDTGKEIFCITVILVRAEQGKENERCKGGIGGNICKKILKEGRDRFSPLNKQ